MCVCVCVCVLYTFMYNSVEQVITKTVTPALVQFFRNNRVVIPETGPRKRKGETVRVIDAVRCLKTFIRRNVSQGTEGVRTATTTEKLQSS